MSIHDSKQLGDVKVVMLKGEKGDKGDGSYDDTAIKALISSEAQSRASADNALEMVKADKTEVNALETNKADKTEVNALGERVSTAENDIDVLDARMDTFASLPDGSTAGDAELLDIRVDYNGNTYPSAGDAVRGQAGDISLLIENKITLPTPTDGKYIDKNGVLHDDANSRVYEKVKVVKGSRIKIVNAYVASSRAITGYDYYGNYVNFLKQNGDWNPSIIELDISNYEYISISSKVGYDIAVSYVQKPLSMTDEAINEIYNKLTNIPFSHTMYNINLSVGIGNAVSLTPETAWEYRYAIVNCSEGDKFIINGTGGTNPRLWGFVDSNNILLSVADDGASVDDGLLLVAPTNASKLIINDYKSGLPCYKVNSPVADIVQDIMSDIDTVINGDESEVDLSSLTQYEYFIAGTSWTWSSNFKCVLIPTEGGHRYTAKGQSERYTNYAFLTSNSRSGVASFCDGETGTRIIPANTEVSIITPDDCKFLYVLTQNNGNSVVPAYFRNNYPALYGTFDELDRSIIDVNTTMEQMANVADTMGISYWKHKPIFVKQPMPYDVKKFNAWAFITACQERLVCLYTKGDGHETSGLRQIVGKYSYDGIVWSDEISVIDIVNSLGAVTAIGTDNDGNLLFWLRDGGIHSSTKHKLYRSTDGGKTIEQISEVSSPTGYTIEGITSILHIPNVGLMSFFCTYLANDNNVWGILTSADNGATWVQTPIESGLTNIDYPSEINGVYLSDGKILALGRKEITGGQYALVQLQSSDYGSTWTRATTNITDIMSSTSSLIYDSDKDLISEFYVDRTDNTLRLRENAPSDIWNNPMNWSDSQNIHTLGFADGGNVNATEYNGMRVTSEYGGSDSGSSIYATLVPYE